MYRQLQKSAAANHNLITFHSACPFMATYANRSCFNYVHYKSNSLTNAEYYCRGAIPGSHLMSLHSQYEHNAAYYELWKHYVPDSVDPFGVYFGMYRNYSISPLWKWTDGTPFDYLPGWSIWAITGQPNADPEAFFMWECEQNICLIADECGCGKFLLALPLVSGRFRTWMWLKMRDGLLHDYSDITTNGICKKNISIYPLWTSLKTVLDNHTAELSTFWSNTNCSILSNGLAINLVNASMFSGTTTAYYYLNSEKIITSPGIGRAPGAIGSLQRPTVAFDAISQIAKYQEELLYISQQMDINFLSNLSYSLPDILMHASYDGAALNFSDFTEKYYAGTGNCFTFNSKDPLRTTNKAGNDRGFELILKLNILEYLITSVSPGFLFLIHNANQTIYPDSQAVKISTGLQSTVVLTYVQPCVDAVKAFGNFSPSYYDCSCPQPCLAKYTAKVNIFFRTLEYSTYERSSAYTFSMLVSDLAQFLGLWLGFSAITFFEIIPLIGSICDASCGYCTCCH
uniref:C-type lectin domain-containing protein n=1 Tax=Romanomermis culicivorax TaxID=13658 RepID=A0A915KYZ2_ROMCU